MLEGKVSAKQTSNETIQKWTLTLQGESVEAGQLEEPKEWIAGICNRRKATNVRSALISPDIQSLKNCMLAKLKKRRFGLQMAVANLYKDK